jgi:hypothetical protein
MSPQPQKAQVAADRLRDLVPESGHLQHMPTHIDVLCGHYQMVVDSNQAAIVADTKFLEREGALNFYSNYRVHNYHFKIYGAMFLGQSKIAIETADQMVATLPEELLRIESPPMADWLEGFVPMKQHVLIRFGRWQDIIDQKLPENRNLYCVTTAMMHYAKSVAHAASGDVPSGEAEAALFDEALKRVPDTRYVFNNSCLDILAVAREMMLGELESGEGRAGPSRRRRPGWRCAPTGSAAAAGWCRCWRHVPRPRQGRCWTGWSGERRWSRYRCSWR